MGGAGLPSLDQGLSGPKLASLQAQTTVWHRGGPTHHPIALPSLSPYPLPCPPTPPHHSGPGPTQSPHRKSPQRPAWFPRACQVTEKLRLREGTSLPKVTEMSPDLCWVSLTLAFHRTCANRQPQGLRCRHPISTPRPFRHMKTLAPDAPHLRPGILSCATSFCFCFEFGQRHRLGLSDAN